MTIPIDCDAYERFSEYVISSYRYVLDEQSRKLMKMLEETTKQREYRVKPENTFYRARKGHDDYSASATNNLVDPYPPEEMTAPPLCKVREGRLNPKGLSYLYVADQYQTAIMEMRPWIGELISVARFSPMKELKVIDLTQDNEHTLKMKRFFNKDMPITPEAIQKQIWSEINHAFSEPVTNTDETAQYAPTQIIAEWIKSWGFDGVKYRSSVHPQGTNYAFFDPAQLDGNKTYGVEKIDSVDCNYHPINNELLRYSTHKEKA